MSKNKKFVLAYSIDNQDFALKLEEHLKNAGFKFEHLSSDNTTLLESLGDQLITKDKSTILLISDNFLKSSRCMKNGLDFIQRLSNSGKLLPVVIDGKYPVEDSNEFEYVPTAFDRVSHIIKYMNFWQEKYLDLRKRKRNISPKEEPEFNHNLNIVRGISSNIGEFLRYLRSIKHFSIEEFQKDGYKAFFDHTNNQEEHKAFLDRFEPERSKVKVEEKEAVLQTNEVSAIAEETPSPDQDLVNLITSASQDILEENGVTEEIENVASENETIVETDEENEPPVDLNEIPGMEFLTGGKEEETKIIDIEEKIEEENFLDYLNETKNEEVEITLESNVESDDLSFLSESGELSESEDEGFEMDLDDLSDLNKEESEEKENVDDILDEILNTPSNLEDSNSIKIEDDLTSIFESQQESASEKEEDDIEKILSASISDEREMGVIEEILNQKVEEEKREEIEEPESDTESIDKLENEEELRQMNQEEKENEALEEEPEETTHIEEEEVNVVEEVAEESIEVEEIIIQDEEVEVTEPLFSISDAYKQFEDGETDEGLKIMKSLVLSNPTDVHTRYQYAFHLAKFGNDFEKATAELEILLSFDDKHEDSYYLLAELAELHRDYLLAKNYYEKVETLNPNYPNVYYRLGLLLLNRFENKKKDALRYLKLAVKQNKKNTDAYYRLGILLNEHFGKHWKAVKYFKKTLKSQKDHPFANYDLAVIYHRLGDRALAYEYYKKAIKINPELQTERNDEAFKYILSDDSEESVFSNLMDQEEDPEYTELKKDMARLEAKMAALNNPPDEEEDEKLSVTELNAILQGEVEETEVPVPITVEEQEIVDETELSETTQAVKNHNDLGRIVLITGATAGIGKATAEVFAQNGYAVILTGRRTERLEEFKTQLEKNYNSNVQILPFDVRDLDATNAAIEALPDEWKNVDILINNAGLAKGMASIHEGDFDLWNQMIDTNLKGLLHITRAVTPYMVKRKTGHVINIGSTSGRDVYPNGNVYCATKYAVDGLTKAMRHDLYKHNIRVSQVLPAHAETEFALVRFDWDKEKAKMYDDFEPLKPEDVAQSVYFIATQPPHVNISEIVLWSTQQLSPTTINRSGRIYDQEE